MWPLLIGFAISMAAQTNAPAPPSEGIVIESEQGAEWDLDTGLAVFRGNVRVTDAPLMRLRCDLFTVKSAPPAGTNDTLGAIEKIVADQNVVMELVTSHGLCHATANRAVYTATNDVVELTGPPHPVVTFPQGNITGPLVILDRKQNKFFVRGGNKWLFKLSATNAPGDTKPALPQTQK
jgi:lipopolysaccharide export system protein LptA